MSAQPSDLDDAVIVVTCAHGEAGVQGHRVTTLRWGSVVSRGEDGRGGGWRQRISNPEPPELPQGVTLAVPLVSPPRWHVVDVTTAKPHGDVSLLRARSEEPVTGEAVKLQCTCRRNVRISRARWEGVAQDVLTKLHKSEHTSVDLDLLGRLLDHAASRRV